MLKLPPQQIRTSSQLLHFLFLHIILPKRTTLIYHKFLPEGLTLTLGLLLLKSQQVHVIYNITEQLLTVK